MIRGYLRHRRSVLALYAAVLILFPFVQLLYGENIVPVAYSLVLLTFLLLLIGFGDFFRFRHRARTLDMVLENLSQVAHGLPEAVGPMEARYHALAGALYELVNTQTEALTQQHSEQLDYYSMWMHQIKTPIAAMRLALESGAAPDVMEAELFKVERYVEMALQYVRMKDLSTDLMLEPLPLAPLVRASVKKYAPLFIGKHLKVEIVDTEFDVLTDEKWFAFILEQLLSNAVKYTDRGGVRIYGVQGDLVIEDTGIGIRGEDLARIFQKGYTGFNGRMDKRASGLGLYMAKRVADQLGIRLYPESQLGKGTKMTVVFPRRDGYIQ